MKSLYALPLLLLGGCATGYVTDWFGDQPAIINPQLIRFGMDVTQARCVSQKLATELSVQRVRQLQQRAELVQQGFADPTRLTPGDFRVVGNQLGDQLVPRVIDVAFSACNVSDSPVAPVALADAAPVAGAEQAGAAGADAAEEREIPLPGPGLQLPPGAFIAPSAGLAGSGAAGAPGSVSTATGVVRATWLNLGAAGTGQAISIDASSIQQQGSTRTAWFRMTDPETGQLTPNHFRLRIDCEARTIAPLARRQVDPAGAVTDYREFTPETDPPQAVEAGTVLEIAFLSMCT